MKILSGAQMARLDRLSIGRHRISARLLMQQAAQACCDEISAWPELRSLRRVVIVCGPGNNGGDGFAMAEILRGRGIAPRVFFLGSEEALSKEARYFFQKIKSLVLPLGSLNAELGRAQLVVDAIFGIGLKRPVTGLFASTILAMNRARAFKLAVDMPSGISAESGEPMGEAFRADRTVTFETPKWGQILPPAWDFVGRLSVHSIGLKRSELAKMPSAAEWVDTDFFLRRMRPRSRAAHKGSAGRVLVAAGSREMPGAGYLCGIAALRSGAGLVTWALPEEAYRRIDLRFPELIMLPVSSEGGQFCSSSVSSLMKKLETAQSLALGPGLGRGDRVRTFLLSLLSKRRPPTVLDADALNLVSENPKLKRWLRGAVLTPHPLEMARLCGSDLGNIREKPMSVARGFAKRYGCWLVLKGYRSVIASPKGELWINSTGGPNLATAGSGDVLTGIIAGLLAQGMKINDAVPCAVFLHGWAGDRLAKKMGDRGTLASDIAKEIPKAMMDLSAGARSR